MRGRAYPTGQCLIGNVGARQASIQEDPANRRNLGGQPDPAIRHNICQIIPASRPEIEAIFHSDFTPVTMDKPARRGETLILLSTGLGTTRPAAEPGQPFPPLDQGGALVTSPVQVNVNGNAAAALNALGGPGLEDAYRIDVQVPSGAAPGSIALQLVAAWIPGHAAKVPVQ